MLKTLGAQIKEFKKVSLLTPLCMIGEVIMEMIIPLMMASIIDDGVEAGNMGHIYAVGACMVVAAAMGLTFGVLGGKLAWAEYSGAPTRLNAGVVNLFSGCHIPPLPAWRQSPSAPLHHSPNLWPTLDPHRGWTPGWLGSSQ